VHLNKSAMLVFFCALPACLSESPSLTAGGDLGTVFTPDLGTKNTESQARPDMAGREDLASPPDMAQRRTDLASTDLAGLFLCYGVAICSPTTDFCIKYHSGSQGVPGSLVNSPACFTPSDTCANQGQQMNCGCIQADATLGPSCQGACIDNQDGTFDCYKS
jgi:hypothetical protein